MQSLQIPPHVYVCATGNGSVLLDLKQNRYFGLGQGESELLAGAVDSWPPPAWPLTATRDEAPEPASIARLCDSLLKDGLLVPGDDSEAPGGGSEVSGGGSESTGARATGLPPSATRVDMKVEFVAVGDELEAHGSMRLADVRNFAAAYLSAWYSLRRRPLSSTVEAVHARKLRRQSAGGFESTRAAELVDIFRRLRPFVFAAEGRCLLHALTLVEFLSFYDLYPDWVIGVTTQPWGAHSWVQSGKFLLDTNPEKVCHFTPILVV
jgi:Transglutaminase-like superfamily